MAQGDVTFFDQFLVDVLESLHDLENDTVKVALVSNTTVPTATTADPRWGAGGTTNFSSNEVSGSGYTAGGETPATPSVTLSGGLAEIDWGDVSWSQTASGPSNIRWAIIYNDTDTGKRCIGFVELGASDHDLGAGDLSITWANPVATLNQA